MSNLDPPSYRLYLKNSIISGKNKHILVEGRDDKYLIEKLWDDFSSQSSFNNLNKILVDSAENLIKGEQTNQFLNNRQKVEFIASSVIGQSYAESFVGFVDRELYKFEWDYDTSAELQDSLNTHEVIQRLVLSRGHSIENYVFDFSILCEVLEVFSNTVYARQAIELFKETFQSSLREACSIGLAATKAQVLSKSNSTIDWKILEIASPVEVSFKFDEWIQRLIGRGISSTQERNLRLYYPMYKEQVSKASISLIRWICHGHTGYDFLRAIYERCIFDVCPNTQDKAKELSGISWVAKDKLLYSFINSWIKKRLQEQFEYPVAIFELLGVTSL
ncbi:MAG TPA: DUF4435 domain-containing protein [Phormidium sp.]